MKRKKRSLQKNYSSERNNPSKIAGSDSRKKRGGYNENTAELPQKCTMPSLMASNSIILEYSKRNLWWLGVKKKTTCGILFTESRKRTFKKIYIQNSFKSVVKYLAEGIKMEMGGNSLLFLFISINKYLKFIEVFFSFWVMPHFDI